MAIEIQNGTHKFGNNGKDLPGSPGWAPEMVDGSSGTYNSFIPFNNSFGSVPNVSVSLLSVNTQNDPATVCVLELGTVETEGFNLTIITHGGSQLWGVDISWIAYSTD